MRNGEIVEEKLSKNNKTKVVIFVIIFATLILSVFLLYSYIKNNSYNVNIYENEYNKDDPGKNGQEIEVISKDLFGKWYKSAEEKLKKMTLEDKIGQMFFARMPENGIENEIKNLKPCGYIMFGRDFKNKTKDEVILNLKSYQNISSIPLLIGVDEEGGTVVRISNNKNFASSAFKSPQQVFKNGGYDGITNDTITKSKLLKEIGINVNLAPVSDVSTNPKDYIYDRSFGKNALETSMYVETVVKAANSQNISSTLKHFPGYGNNIDTHTGISFDKRNYDTFKTSDFLPFISGINAGVQSILVSHNIIECIDGVNPASISSKIHDILRNELDFTGVIMTDDLAMDGIKKYEENENAAVLAVIAGNDLIITSDLKLHKEAVINAVKSGKITEDTINKAVKRILAWKYSISLI